MADEQVVSLLGQDVTALDNELALLRQVVASTSKNYDYIRREQDELAEVTTLGAELRKELQQFMEEFIGLQGTLNSERNSNRALKRTDADTFVRRYLLLKKGMQQMAHISLQYTQTLQQEAEQQVKNRPLQIALSSTTTSVASSVQKLEMAIFGSYSDYIVDIDRQHSEKVQQFAALHRVNLT